MLRKIWIVGRVGIEPTMFHYSVADLQSAPFDHLDTYPFSGKDWIRTSGSFHPARFQDVSIKPLCHFPYLQNTTNKSTIKQATAKENDCFLARSEDRGQAHTKASIPIAIKSKVIIK
jgi:hypothetical protein